MRERVAELEKTEAELKRAVSERDEMLGFLTSSVKTTHFSSPELDSENGCCYYEMGLRFGKMGVCEEMEECFMGGMLPSSGLKESAHG
nr:uncharacterized protein LOC109152641 isoform X1 [Ipomoea batatas]